MGSRQGRVEAIDHSLSVPSAVGGSSAPPARSLDLRSVGVAIARWLRGRALVQVWARDRALAIATALLAAVTLTPMFVTPFLPLADLPDHVAQGALMPQILLGRGLAAHHYSILWAPVPYWTTHVIIATLAPLFGALVAAKVMVGIAVLALPLAVMRVMVTLGRDPRLALWTFILSWDHNLYLGWTAFSLGMSLALWGTAWLLEARTLRQALLITLLAALIGLTHVQAVAYFGLMVVALLAVRRPIRQAIGVHAIAGLGLAVSVLPWLKARLSAGGQLARPSFTFEFHTLRDKLASLFKYSVDNQPLPTLSGIAFIVLLLGPVVLASVLVQTNDARDHDRASRLSAATGMLFLLVPLALYLLVPWSLSGPLFHWYTYPRYATLTLASLLLLPRIGLGGWRALWLLPGVVAAALLNLSIARQFADYATRARPFLDVIAHVKPNSSFLPLQLDDADPAMSFPPFSQIHAYVAAVKGGYDPHLFDNASIPFQYRPEHRLPQPAYNLPGAFSLDLHGRFYDYVLVQGLSRDPFPHLSPLPDVRPRLVVEAGRFRLYAIEKG